MPTDILNILSILSLILTIAGIIGGIVAFKSGAVRTANEVQGRVIDALESEVHAHQLRIKDIEEHSQRYQQLLETLCAALKLRGLTVHIDDHVITIIDQTSSTTTTTRIQLQEN